MRRLVVLIGTLLLALPAAAGAIQSVPGDGNLVIDNAQGVVVLNVRGGIIGRFDQGTIEITDPIPGDGSPQVVRGWQQKYQLGPGRTLYKGEGGDGVRFRLIGGLYRARITAIGMDVSVVGHGTVLLDGSGFGPDQPGQYSLNGGPFQPMPQVPTRLTLGLPQPATLGSR
jgi:hypothetical protein